MSAARKSKQFWAWDEARLAKVTGYECPPNKGMWWIPELGWSGEEGHALFATKREARDAAIKETEKEIARLKKVAGKLDRIKPE